MAAARRRKARPAKAPRRRARGAVSKGARLTLIVATKKGAFFFRSDAARRTWTPGPPRFFGHVVNHVVLDPRDGRTLLAGVRTGHLGPTVFRSSDGGRTWTEAKRPPALGKPEGEAAPRTVKAVFWLTPGHETRPGEWWAGTVPHGLFRSADAGVTWDECAGFTAAWRGWVKFPGRVEDVPDGAITHSVIVDPRDPAHLYVGLSTGGLFESLDEGATWTPLNRGVEADFLPEKNPEFGQDPHCAVLHPLAPDRLWHQNHCGIYRLDRPGETWERVGRNMPKPIGDVGFPIVLHPRDIATAWVVPMDGRDVWPRTSVAGRPAVYRTKDLGHRWQRQDRGFPRGNAWWTVKRQALAADRGDPVGLYLGTTSGSVWASRDEGATWREIARDLPHVLAVTVAAGV